MDLKLAYKRYKAHLYHCDNKFDRRGNKVEMKLTFEEWVKIWRDSGKWEQRGRCAGQYCMARINDLGHYEVGNVEIKTHRENMADIPSKLASLRHGTNLTKKQAIAIYKSNLKAKTLSEMYNVSMATIYNIRKCEHFYVRHLEPRLPKQHRGL